MTQNQIAYQQNKLREQENAIKAREAAVKEGQHKLAQSQHIHEYGFVEVPNAKTYHNYGDKASMTQVGARANSLKRMDTAGGLLNNIGNAFKNILSGGLFSFFK